MFRPFRWLMGAARVDGASRDSVPAQKTASVKPLGWPLAEELCNSRCAFCEYHRDAKPKGDTNDRDHVGSNYSNPVTSELNRPFSAAECDVFANEPTWNECLWRLGLELREDGTVGMLSVVTLEGRLQYRCPRCSAVHALAAARCLRALLTAHCCIQGLHVSPALMAADCQGLLEALYGNERIEVLTIPNDFPCAPGLRGAFVRAVSSMTALRELRCSEEDYSGSKDGSTARVFCEFIEGTTMLRTFQVTLLHASDAKDCTLFKSLMKNASLKNLIFCNLHFGPEQGERCAAFEDLLQCSGMLEYLMVSPGAGEGVALALQALSRAMAVSTTFKKLKMVDWTVNDDSLRAVAAIIACNWALRKFDFVRTKGGNARYPPASAEDAQKEDPKGKAAVRALLTALRRNTKLKEVSFDLSAFNASNCRHIIEELSRNPSLERVFIQPERHNHAGRLCLELRKHGSLAALLPKDRPDVGGTPLPFNSLGAKLEARFITNLNSWEGEDAGPQQGVFIQPSFNTVVILCLKVPEAFFWLHVSDNLARYVCGTTTLRVLSIIIVPVEPEVSADAQVAVAAHDVPAGPELNFIKELSANVSLQRLLLSGLNLEEADCSVLAQTIRSSRSIYDFTFGRPGRCHRRVSETLVEAMAPGFPKENRTLSEFQTDVCIEAVPAWCVVQNAVHRNSTSATLAARFVLGNDGVRCADALQQMTDGTTKADRNMALVSRICQLGGIVEDHLACSAISKRLKVLDSMNGFMRIVGVVRDRVECHPHPEGRKQLADLDKYAWLALRRHLRPSYVRQPSAGAACADVDVGSTADAIVDTEVAAAGTVTGGDATSADVEAEAKPEGVEAPGADADPEERRPCSPKKAAKGSWIFKRHKT